MTRVLLIRHADVENPDRVFYGHLEGFGLSAIGRAQATAIGQTLRASGLRRIVHSPLLRTRETAEIIAAQLPDTPLLEPEPALVEASFGRYLQGIPYWQVPFLRPFWLVHRLRRGLAPGDETVGAMGERILGVVNRLARSYPDEISACVSHGDPLQAAWVLLEGRPPTGRELARKPVPRGAMLTVDLDDDQPVAIDFAPPPIATGR